MEGAIFACRPDSRKSFLIFKRAQSRSPLDTCILASDLMFLMGTIHRFPDQWLIVSLIYPPKQPPEVENQLSLFAP